MVDRNTGLLLSGIALLLLALVAGADGQPTKEPQSPKGKESFLPAMPQGYDKARAGIVSGKLESVEYDSKTTVSKRKIVVYLPPGYSKDKANRGVPA